MEMSRSELALLVEAHLDDRFHDECGVVGVHGHPEAAKITYLGLYALQHRGQESAGIVSNPGAHRPQAVHRGMGLVADVFHERILEELEGRNAIGHVRYSTAGGSSLVNAQPFCATTDAGPIAIAHNGNIVNFLPIRREPRESGSREEGEPRAGTRRARSRSQRRGRDWPRHRPLR